MSNFVDEKDLLEKREKEDLENSSVDLENGEESTGEEEVKEEEKAKVDGDKMPQDFEEEDGSSRDEVQGLKDELTFLKSRVRNLEDENKRLKNESEAYKSRLTSLNSEYENYRKRTDKEKGEISDDCTVKVLKDIVAPIDNLERALILETDDLEGLKEGVTLTLEQFKAAFGKLGVEEIPTEEGFNPELHEAVMHEVDPSKEKNIVGEVLLKGYRKGNKVIRHTVVKVIN